MRYFTARGFGAAAACFAAHSSGGYVICDGVIAGAGRIVAAVGGARAYCAPADFSLRSAVFIGVVAARIGCWLAACRTNDIDIKQ